MSNNCLLNGVAYHYRFYRFIQSIGVLADAKWTEIKNNSATDCVCQLNLVK